MERSPLALSLRHFWQGGGRLDSGLCLLQAAAGWFVCRVKEQTLARPHFPVLPYFLTSEQPNAKGAAAPLLACLSTPKNISFLC